jgi:hypothetical protein
MREYFGDEFLATWIAELLERMTGDRTRLINGRRDHGKQYWKIERWTGTEWVEG